MRRIILIMVTLCMNLCLNAQNEYSDSFMRFYIPNSDGTPFPMPVDAYVTISEKGETYIKIHANNPNNAAEFSDYQKYAILKGRNMYLKLDNEEIITLSCSLNKIFKDGFVTTKSSVYQNYADYSYFPIDTAVIEKLKSHDVVKVRGQFKFEIMDGSMQFTTESEIHKTKDNFIKAEQAARRKYNDAKDRNKVQKTLKENPLHGF